MRKLVTIRKISDISAIKGADFIQKASIDGWECVIKRDEFSIGDYGLFFEIDSFIPSNDSRFEFLGESSIRKYQGISGYRIRTMRLKKQISQGLLLSIEQFPDVIEKAKEIYPTNTIESAYKEKMDFADTLGVVKYDTFFMSSVTASAGSFPSLVPITDQERIENLYESFVETINPDQEYYYTLKMDGSSMTVVLLTPDMDQYDTYDKGDEYQQVVCSRNLAIKPSKDSKFWYAAERQDIFDKLSKIGLSVAIQGELVGPGIQGNREKFAEPTFMAFSMWNLDTNQSVPYETFLELCKEFDIRTVPVIKIGKPLKEFGSLIDMKAYVENMKPIHADVPEGIVFHARQPTNDRHFDSFKVVSRKYLLKNNE